MSFFAGDLKATISADNKGFTTAINQSQKQVNTFGGFVEKNSAKIKGMGIAMTAAGGLIVAGLGKMISSATRLGDTFDKMAIRTGASTEMLSALRFASEQSGASLEIVEKGFTRLSKNMFDSTLGLAEAKRGFEALGITVTKNNGELKSTDTVFLELAEKFKVMKDGAEKSAIANTIFGRSGVQLIPILNQGKEGIEELSAEAEKLGIIFSKDDAKAAANLTDDMNSLSKSFEGTFKTLSIQMMPILSDIANSITGVITKITAWIKENPELTRVLTITTAALGGFMLLVGPLLIALPAMANGFAILKAKITGIGPVLGRLAAAGAAFYVGWEIGKAIDDFLGLSSAIQKGVDQLSISVEKWEKLSMIQMGWTEHGKQVLFLRGTLIDLAKQIDPTVTGLRGAAQVIKNNKEAYDSLHPRLQRVVDGMTKLRPAIQGVIDKGAEIPRQTEEQRKVLESILETSGMRIRELTLSETDFKIEQLNREYQKNIEILNQNAATKSQIQILERAHILEISRIREESYLAQKEKEKKRFEEEKKAKEEEFRKEEERWQTHSDFLEALRKEQQDLILQNIEERDGWRAAELMRVDQWELDQKTILYNRLQDQKITFAQYQEELTALKQAGESKREAIDIEARKRELERIDKLFMKISETINKSLKVYNFYLDTLSNLFNAFTTIRENELNAWYDAELQRINESSLSNEAKTIAIEELDAKMYQKKQQLEAAAAKREKVMAIGQAIANTAVAITKAMTVAPWPFNIPAIAFAIATGAAQIAAIGGAYKAPGMESFAPGGGETGGGETGGGGGGVETGGGGRKIEAFQAGTNGYITPPRDFIVGDPYSPERVQLRGDLQNVGMSVTPLGQTAPISQSGVNIHLDFSGMHIIDATDFENRVRDFLPRLMQQFFNNGIVNVPRGRVR